jgi:hypothetical protein
MKNHPEYTIYFFALIHKLYTEYHGERKTGKERSLPMGETTVAEYEAVLPFGISGLVPSHMKYSNPLSILLHDSVLHDTAC